MPVATGATAHENVPAGWEMPGVPTSVPHHGYRVSPVRRGWGFPGYFLRNDSSRSCAKVFLTGEGWGEGEEGLIAIYRSADPTLLYTGYCRIDEVTQRSPPAATACARTWSSTAGTV